MVRIPDEEIERLKRDVPIERLVRATGIDCITMEPIFSDAAPSTTTASLRWSSRRKNLWHCLGACNTGGSVIDWIIKTRGVSFRHAVELFKADHPARSAHVEKIVCKDPRQSRQNG